jgi:hypothetical protein
MVDFTMINHVIPMSSWQAMPSPWWVVCHWMPSMPLRLVPSCAQGWHKCAKPIPPYVGSNIFSIGEGLVMIGAMQRVDKGCL